MQMMMMMMMTMLMTMMLMMIFVFWLEGGFAVDDNAAADNADDNCDDADDDGDADVDDVEDVDDDFHILVVRWVRRMRLVPAGTVADYSNV